MKVWKRILSAALSAFMIAAGLPLMGTTDKAVGTAEAASPRFTKEEFNRCYTKILLEQVGKEYSVDGAVRSDGTKADGSGYKVGGVYYKAKDSRVKGGTPYNPLPVTSQSFDCHGLVLTCLMAMGYDYFEDENGKQYPLNAYYGGSLFDHDDGTNGRNTASTGPSLLYDHKTGDIIYLHHSTDKKYTMKFQLGEIVDKSVQTDTIAAGTLIFSLDSNNPKVTAGPFKAGEIKYVNHSAVALFKLPKDPSDLTSASAALSWQYEAQYNEALKLSYARAMEQVNALKVEVGLPDKNFEGGITKYVFINKSTTEKHFIPYVWDARGRGRYEANATRYDVGFRDGCFSGHFNTPYNDIWQIESIAPGVCIDNNPMGKTTFRMAVDMLPVEESGSVTISKKDSATGDLLSGAEFTLYEWSETQGKYVLSTDYCIKEKTNASGVYVSFNKAINKEENIIIDGENLGKIKIVESKPPKGYDGGWSAEYTFETDGDKAEFVIDALNDGSEVGWNIVKRGYGNIALPGAVFTRYDNEVCTGTGIAYTTDANGKASFTERLASVEQVYYLKETTVPDGYKSDGEIYRITISKASTGTIAIAKKLPGDTEWTAVSTISAENAREGTGSVVIENRPATKVRIRKIAK